ncbi:MAG: PHP domain-containing protein [Micrococcaceae bacterium]
MAFDLHTHSYCSDGTQSPAEVVRAAAEAGLEGIALTDHDTTAGWDEAVAAGARFGVSVVPGMEISCVSAHGISVHLLSYLHDPNHQGLCEEMERSVRSRLTRAERMAQRLSEDFPITWELVQAQTEPGATVGRPHLADALVAAGVVPDRSAAFASILLPSSPYYVAHYASDPAEAVRLVREAGGVPVFAHPRAVSRGRVVGQETFEEMIEAGLLGLEVEHRDNPEPDREWLRALAQRHDLLITGSSDYHGTGKPNRLGEHTTSRDIVERIAERGVTAVAW